MDEIDIEVDTDDFVVDIVQMVHDLRKRISEAGISIVSIGRYKEQIYIYIRDMETKKKILPYMLDSEKEIITFNRV